MKTESIQEFTNSRGVTLAVEEGVIRGVKVLGAESRNGRKYPKATIEKAAPLYEGAKVNIDHPKESSDPRSYRDRVGALENVQVKTDGLYADLKYNPKHPLAEQLQWDAEHAPENLGLSHNAQARTRRDKSGVIVEDIVALKSVDLVADPASTSTLFEGDGQGLLFAKGDEMEISDLTLEVLQEQREDLLAELLTPIQEQLETVTAERDELKAQAERGDKIKAIEEQLKEAGVPGSEIFIESLLPLDDEKRAALIADRKTVVEHREPTSAAKGGTGLDELNKEQRIKLWA